MISKDSFSSEVVFVEKERDTFSKEQKMERAISNHGLHLFGKADINCFWARTLFLSVVLF
jgi:hypothetical protein